MNLVLALKLKLNKSDYSIQIMVEIGIVEIIGLGAPLVSIYGNYIDLCWNLKFKSTGLIITLANILQIDLFFDHVLKFPV